MDITLVEYARKHGRTLRSVQAMAQRGRFRTARKLGRDWLIDANEPYPADARVKSGKYVGWRDKSPDDNRGKE